MKKLCLLLCVVLTFSLLGGCNSSSKPKKDKPSKDSSKTETADSNSSDSSNSSELDMIDNSNDPSVNDPIDHTVITDPSAEPETEVTDLYVYNNRAPISTNYRGMSGTVYHAHGFMKDEQYGRVYTDKMMKTELDRLQNTGIHYTRTMYASNWVWGSNVTGWNWKSNRFNYFCDYAKAMQQRDISVLLQVGWHFGFITGITDCSIGEVSYLRGEGNDRYGESYGYNFSGLSNEDARMVRGARRFGYWVSESLRQFRARGIHNISHLLYFVEPSNGYSGQPAGCENREYLLICRAMIEKMKEEGVADTVKHMGPNEASDTGDDLLKYTLDNDPDLFDAISCHFYPGCQFSGNDIFYDNVTPVFDSYQKHMENAGQWHKKEFWLDEFDCREEGLAHDTDDPWLGIQVAYCNMIAQQRGITNTVFWQLFDQLWTDNGSDGGEWVNGIHVTGVIPSMFVSAVPQAQYYPISLFMKYNGYQNGTVYATNLDELAEEYTGVYMSAVKLEDGNWTITIVNLNIDPATFVVRFDKAIGQTLYRHVAAAAQVKPTVAARIPAADKTYVSVADKFTDTIPAGSIAVYTGVKN